MKRTKMNKRLIYKELKKAGADPKKKDFHRLTSNQREIVTAYGKLAAYRKPKSASGSYARYFYSHMKNFAFRNNL